jgi:formamidase
VAEGWHNRWHPQIEPVGTLEQGSVLTIETREGTDGAIGPGSGPEDLTRVDFARVHQLSGPYFVTGAQPGDVLEVEWLDVSTAAFGFTAIFPGFGALADLFPEPDLLTWEIEGGLARSERLPGIAVPGAPFAGVVGVAPAHNRVVELRQRDILVVAAGGTVIPDQPEGAVPVSAAGGLRTVAPRDFGGNLDIRQLRPGAKLLLPVQVPGALLSVGDLHFAQGDGEVCGSGIECAGAVTLRVTVLEPDEWRPRMPAFSFPGERARPSFVTTGMPEGDQMAELDLIGAVRSALLQMLEYLTVARSVERQAAYALMSAVVDLRISQMVNAPNPLVSAFVPLDIFVD